MLWRVQIYLYSDPRNVARSLLFIKQEDRSVKTQFDVNIGRKRVNILNRSRVCMQLGMQISKIMFQVY